MSYFPNTTISGVQDEYGFELEYTPDGESRTVTPYRVVGATFEGASLDAIFWSTTGTSGTGTVTQTGGEAVFSTGAGVGTATLTSVRFARFVAGTSNVLRVGAKLNTTGFVDNTSLCGVYDGTDGAFFEIKDAVFNVVTSKGGTPTRVPNGTFNGNMGATVTIDTNYHVWEIYYNDKNVIFTMDGAVVHTVTASASTWSNKLTFPVKISTVNTAGVTVASFNIRSLTVNRLGSAANTPVSNQTNGQTAGKSLKIGPGVLHTFTLSGSTNNSAITLYDSTSATGTIIWQSTMAGGVFMTIDFKGISFVNGLYLVIATQNSNVTVVYE